MLWRDNTQVRYFAMSRELVEKWIAYCQNRQTVTNFLLPVWEQVDEIIDRDPEMGWLLVLDLVEAAPDDLVLANIAAGPLENLLNNSSDLLVDRVDNEARRNPKFRRCLTGVWGLPTSIQSRIAKYLSTVVDPL